MRINIAPETLNAILITMKTKTLFCLLGISGMIMLFSCKKDSVAKQQTGIVSQRLMGGEDDEWISTVVSTADGGHLIRFNNEQQ